MKLSLVLGFALIAGMSSRALAVEVTGAGATFPYPIYAQWAGAYKQKTGITISYDAVGSGLGIQRIKDRSITFGASDMPLKPEELEANGLIQFPTVVAGDVPVVNLPGVKRGEMTLDGPTLADIYLGKIDQWDDPAIKRLNPRLNLPAFRIAVTHRLDGSGTTFIWANYLSQVSKEWADRVGTGTTVPWPVGVGANGNEGVSSAVAETPGSIGYVE